MGRQRGHGRLPQGEGGEQGDPLMPLLFALGQYEALQAVSRGRVQDSQRRTKGSKFLGRLWDTQHSWLDIVHVLPPTTR